MKNFLKLSTLVLAIYSIASSANAATQSGTASARVVTPLSISQTTPLEFGSFASGASAGTITSVGVATDVAKVTTNQTNAVFSVTGDSVASTAYTFTLPPTAILNSGANNMVATLSFASGTGNGSRTLSSGTDTVTVHGSLAVPANQASGSYTGTYSVTANY